MMQVSNPVLFSARKAAAKKQEPMNALTAAGELEAGLKGQHLRGLKVEWRPGAGAGWESPDGLRLLAKNPNRLLNAVQVLFKKHLTGFSPARTGGYQAHANYKGVGIEIFGTQEVPYPQSKR